MDGFKAYASGGGGTGDNGVVGRVARWVVLLGAGLGYVALAGAQTTCINTSVAPTAEQQRLTAKLTTGNANAFAVDLLASAGFDHFAPDFVAALCGAAAPGSYDQALAVVHAQGQLLWRAAVDRVQGRKLTGTLPRGDDRMLYWARLAMSKALRQWQPAFAADASQRDQLEYELQRASRGQYDINFPVGATYKRIVVSGTDPYGFPNPGANGAGLRNGSPSSAIAMSLDGTRTRMPDGSTAVIEAFLLPVSYAPLMAGMQEDTLGPLFAPGAQHVDASITLGQGSGDQFWLEQWNGRFHGPTAGDDNASLCPTTNNGRIPPTGECDIYPPARWLGYESKPWLMNNPPQFTSTSLPVAAMIADDTGSGVPRPPTDSAVAPDAFDVVWHPNYTLYPDCTSTNIVVINSPVPGFPLPFTYPYPVTPPLASWCARQGGAGDYLANESAYRDTLLRDTLGLATPAGHISTPVMTRFLAASTNVITDSMFESYRNSIVQQGRNLLFSVARNLSAPATPLVTKAAPVDMYIWPAQVGPGSEGLASLKLTLQERSTDASINDRAATGVTRPTLTMYAPVNPSGVAILVAPGGGYSHETIDKEGTDVAWAFNPIGVTVFVLTYRMPDEGHVDSVDVVLEDAQRAMRVIRANASQWHLDPGKIGVMGFSAGGHLAGSLGTLYDKQVYTPVDSADALSARPDFMVLLYPVITMDLTFGEPGTRTALLGKNPTADQIKQWSLENWVTPSTPPAFVAMAANDGTVNPPHNGILFSQLLAANGVATELHEFALGGHGFGIRAAVGDGLTWPVLAQNWMASIGMK